jgi:hypothetical protein
MHANKYGIMNLNNVHIIITIKRPAGMMKPIMEFHTKYKNQYKEATVA